MNEEIGVVGLGKIGLGVVRRLTRHGMSVVGLDRRPEARAAAEAAGAFVVGSLPELVDRLEAPRTVWLLLPAGDALSSVVGELETLLEAGDLVVDGGNSDYRDSIARHAALAERGLKFLDVGTSGGIAGEKLGFCLMVGGDAGDVERARRFLEALAPAPDRGWARVGEAGAGHFAKMAHNGIEYGLMQAYAEGLALVDARGDLGLDAAAVAELWGHGSVIRSWLLELVARGLRRPGGLADVAPFVPDSGAGRWAVREAVDLGIPAPVIAAALTQRFRSRDDGGFGDRLLAVLRQEFGGHEVRRVDERDG